MQKNPRESLLAGMQNLIYEVFLDSDYAREEIRDHQLCKRRLSLHYLCHGCSLHSGDGGLVNRRGGRPPQRPAHETALTKKIALPQDREDRPFAPPGCDRDFHVAIQNVEHRVSHIALPKDGLFITVLPRSFLLADLLQKIFCSEVESIFADHKYPSELMRKT